MTLTHDQVVGPPPTNGRGVLVVFLSFCIGFYSILSVSRCATGPFFYLVFSFLVFFLIVGVGFGGGWGGVRGGRNNVLSRAFYLTPLF